MEVVKPWEEMEEEEVPLRGRLPRQHSNTTISTTAIATSKDVDDDTSSSESGKSSSSDEATNNGTQRNGVSNGENGDAKSTNGHSVLDGRYDDFFVSKQSPTDQTLELEKNGVKFEEIDVVNNQNEVKPETVDLPASNPSPSSFQKENGKYVSLSNGGTSQHEEVTARSRSGEEEEEEEEEIKEEELDLERLYNRQGRHEFVCPNCRACITKVLVRERASPRPERVRCTSCFSFLTLAGKIFWPDNYEDIDPLSPVGSHEPLRGQRSQGQAVPRKTPVAKQPVTTSATDRPDNFETQSHQNTQAASAIITPVLQKGVKAVVITENKPSSDDIAGLQDLVTTRSVTSEIEQKTGTQSIVLEASLNNSDSVPVVQEEKTLKDSNGTLHNKKHSLRGLFEAIFSPTTRRGKIENIVTDKVPDLSVNIERPKLNDLKIPLLAQSPEVAETVTTEDPVFGSGVPVSTEAFSPIQGEVLCGEVAITVAENNAGLPEQGSSKSWEILKSIVYGGLAESIASLGIVTSAASGKATTLNIVSLALANLLGGLFIIVHNIWELKDDQSKVHCSRTNKQVDRYEEVLGKRHNFILHVFVAILSFIIFGLVPPVVYGFMFRQTDDKDLKLAAVAVASLVCITLLAVAKAEIQNPHKYFKTMTYYFVIALGVSGVSYLAGEFISQLMEKIESSGATPAFTLPPPAMAGAKNSWGSY